RMAQVTMSSRRERRSMPLVQRVQERSATAAAGPGGDARDGGEVVGNRIPAAGSPRVTAAEASQGEPSAPGGAMEADRLLGVRRARGHMTARHAGSEEVDLDGRHK